MQGIKQIPSGINEKKLLLHVSLYNKEDDGLEEVNCFDGSQIVFKKDSQTEVSSTKTTDGEIYVYIGAGMRSFRRVENARRLLRQNNNAITEIKIQCQKPWPENHEFRSSSEIRQYIVGVNNFIRCHKLSFYNGYFFATPIENIQDDNNQLTENNSQKITQLQFERCGIDPNSLSQISNAYPDLEYVEFINCKFRRSNIRHDPSFMTRIELELVNYVCLRVRSKVKDYHFVLTIEVLLLCCFQLLRWNKSLKRSMSVQVLPKTQW